MWFHHNDFFPVRLVLLGAASPAVGGGSAVMLGVLLSIMTDATAEAERSLAFLRLHIATMCGFLLSPTLSSLMMERTGTPWYNLAVGLVLLGFGATAIFVVPETLRKKGKKKPGATSDDADSSSHDEEDDKNTTILAQVLQATRTHVIESLWIFRSRDLVLLLLVCLAYMPLLNSTVQLMVPFVSKRYAITIARTGYVQTAYGLMQIVQSLVVLPWLMRHTVAFSPDSEAAVPSIINTNTSTNINGITTIPSEDRNRDSSRSSNLHRLFLLPKYPTTQHRDLHLAILSFTLLAAGGLVLALAPTLTVFVCGLALLALGTGYTSLVRSLMSLYVSHHGPHGGGGGDSESEGEDHQQQQSHTSRLFGLTGMVETLGGVYSSPLLSVLFSLGMRLGGGGGGGGVWIGLPWFALSGFMVICILLLLRIRLPADQKGGRCDEEEAGAEAEEESPAVVTAA